MSHQIESMAYFGQAPWHGLGTPLQEDDLYDWQKACVTAGLDWEAERVPLVTADCQTKVDHVAIRRKSDGRILGTVGARYTILQNRDAFGWFQPFLDANEACLHTAGSLQGGSRIWVLAKLNRVPIIVAAGDEVETFILLSHAHDGTLAVRVGFTPIRVVCANTLALAHGCDGSKLIRLKHTKDVHRNLADIREIMSVANQQFEASAEQFRLLARKSINQDDLKRYVKCVLKIEDEANPSTRIKNSMEEMISLCETGKGNTLPAVRGTLWTAYNGAAEWLAYNRGRNEQNRLNSLWFGDSASLNRQALEIALAMAV
jgi:phage/plasmid-like protein (TIGR03299 family)